eukprot:Lithocolla_globosa_v1_NODE_2945_length_1815_cov_5.456250.p5 type:complete len:101 gc:universal NODE_2945_length_1815_cov_5.456250:882-580(-)
MWQISALAHTSMLPAKTSSSMELRNGSQVACTPIISSPPSGPEKPELVVFLCCLSPAATPCRQKSSNLVTPVPLARPLSHTRTLSCQRSTSSETSTRASA